MQYYSRASKVRQVHRLDFYFVFIIMVLGRDTYIHVPCSHIGHEIHTIVVYLIYCIVSHCLLRGLGKILAFV
ncbi:hypothetical protein M6B38_245865 [Iris pallida]|uniref:Uncharacterized protein n=1 Tax=Iris pallida TaxID=29817 RepID=A0AAX6DHB6_IRIPA|nr:hypothetical protein M6B38_245865 [Iris pallida]